MEFIQINNNPRRRKTSDCAIRAISFVTNKKWNEVFEELSKIAIKSFLTMSDKRTIIQYLKNLNYEEVLLPKKSKNQYYTLDEFNEMIAEKDKTYLVNTIGHLTVIKDKKLYDTFDVSKKPVGYYWVIE